MNDLQKLIAETNKTYGRNVIGYAKDMDELRRVSSGSAYLDWALGGGFPLKRIVEIYGLPASGKTLISLKTIAEAQKQGLPCIFIDAEGTFEKTVAAQLGVDVEKLIVLEIKEGENIFDFIRDAMTAEEKGVIVVDSVASLVPNYEEENDMDKQSMGLLARLMSKGIRVINSSNRGWLVIFINQVRQKIGVMFGNPETTPGGMALDFYSSIRLRVSPGEKYVNDDDVRVGQEVKFRVEKSKVCPPFRLGSFKYFYNVGVDRIDEMLVLGLELKMASQTGAWYTLLGERFNGKAAIIERLKTDKAFYDKFEAELRKVIDASSKSDGEGKI